MDFMAIDETKCKKDGLCAAVCPMGLIELETGETFPAPVEDAQERCILCGHCQAVCPHGALTLEKVRKTAPFEKKHLPTLEQLNQLIRGRRSIRVYRKEPVDRDLMSSLIDLARHAPTARNSQLIGWLVIDDREELKRLTGLVIDWMHHLVDKNDPLAHSYHLAKVIGAWKSGYDPILRGAPGLVVLHGPQDYPLAVVDSSIALTTFELAAFSQGVGTCWAGFFSIAAGSWPPLAEALDLPEGRKLTYAMMVGYPAVQYQRLPERKAPEIIWR